MTAPRTRIYLDHASATPVRKEASDAYHAALPFSGNPGALHAEGAAARRSLEHARASIARHLGCKSRELIFTSGLSESNNLAVFGFAQTLQRSGVDLSGTHWIVSAIEHPSVLACFDEIERLGAAVSRLSPGSRGLISPETLLRELRGQTKFVSIGWGNSEIGVVQPLSRLSRAIRSYEREHGLRILLHSDAGQAPLYRAPSVATLGIDLLSIGSGKLYGPRGVGALYLSKRTDLAPVTIGGSQERGMRAGTENVALVAGFAAALESAAKERESEGKRLGTLRDELAKGIREAVPEAIFNGDLKYALPHMLNVSIPEIDGEYLVLALDRAGLALSTKSACEEGTSGGSHVVAALGGPAWRATHALRFSLGAGTTELEIKHAIAIFEEVYKRVKSIV